MTLTEQGTRRPGEEEDVGHRHDPILVDGYLAGTLQSEGHPGPLDAQPADARLFHAGAQFIDRDAGIRSLCRRYESIINGLPLASKSPTFQLAGRLGEGGQGVVYLTECRGTDGFANTHLALKVFSPHLYPTVDAYETDMHRIGQVASIVAGIDQGNVLNVQRFETFEGVRLMLMKQVEGYDLRRLMDSSSLHRVREVRPDLWDEITKVIANFGPVHARFTPGAAVAIVRCCLTALDKLHSRGLVYGDVKPSNIMLTPEGEVKIVDIGSAFQLAKTRKPYFCTPEYAAPEVLECGECTPRSDLASLGYVLIELLIGRPAFVHSSRSRTTERSIAQEATTGIPPAVDRGLIEEKHLLPRRLEALLPSYGPILRQFIQKLIAPDPRDRFGSAREAEVDPDCGGYVYFKQLVLSRLDSHFQNEFRVWLETLG